MLSNRRIAVLLLTAGSHGVLTTTLGHTQAGEGLCVPHSSCHTWGHFNNRYFPTVLGAGRLRSGWRHLPWACRRPPLGVRSHSLSSVKDSSSWGRTGHRGVLELGNLPAVRLRGFLRDLSSQAPCPPPWPLLGAEGVQTAEASRLAPARPP